MRATAGLQQWKSALSLSKGVGEIEVGRRPNDGRALHVLGRLERASKLVCCPAKAEGREPDQPLNPNRATAGRRKRSTHDVLSARVRDDAHLVEKERVCLARLERTLKVVRSDLDVLELEVLHADVEHGKVRALKTSREHGVSTRLLA